MASVKRMSISYSGTTVDFAVNPQEYQYSRPQRASTYKTQNTNVIQQFGPDLGVITISGNTGWRKDGTNQTGEERFNNLFTLLQHYQNDTQNGAQPSTELSFNNYTDGKYYTVTIAKEGIQYERTVDNPLLFNFVIAFIVVKGSGTPSQDRQVDSQTGTGTGQSINIGSNDSTSTTKDAYYAAVQTLEDTHATARARAQAHAKLNELMGGGH